MLYQSLFTFTIFLLSGIFGIEEHDCLDSRECENEEFTSDDDLVNCYGHYSCNNTRIHTKQNILCDGYYGCYNAEKLETTENIYCRGMKSCVTSQSTIDAETVYCFGDQSCQETKIHSGPVSYCTGVNSCLNADVSAGIQF